MITTSVPKAKANKPAEKNLVRCPICKEYMDANNWGSVLTHEHRGMTSHAWKKTKPCEMRK